MPTDRQQAILDHLAAYLAANGRPPTLGELARDFGIAVNAARKHLLALETKGLIEIDPGKARGIRFETLNATCTALSCQPGDILAFAPDTAAREQPALRTGTEDA